MLPSCRGFLIAATGGRYVQEARPLVSTIREFMPDTPVHLVTDEVTDVPEGMFDSVDRFHVDDAGSGLTHTGFLFRILALARTPFSHTIHLDCDTVLGAPVYEMFHGLRRFDMLVGAAPTRVLDFGTTAENLPPGGKGALSIVPRINVGVIGFSHDAVEAGLFEIWSELYLRGAKAAAKSGRKKYGDQSVFRRLIWESGVNYQIMTPEYHLRTGRSCAIEGAVRILHGRPRRGLLRTIKDINSVVDHRIYLPDTGLLVRRARNFELIRFSGPESDGGLAMDMFQR